MAWENWERIENAKTRKSENAKPKQRRACPVAGRFRVFALSRFRVLNPCVRLPEPRRIQPGLLPVLGMSLLLFGATPLQAQEETAPSVKGAVLKSRAPVSKEILRVKLPRGHESTLPNGLRVIVLEDHKVPTFSMQMVVLSGGLSDPPDRHGLASFTASLLREGTSHRTSQEIAEQVESLGATLSGGGGRGRRGRRGGVGGAGLASFSTSVSVSGLSENLDAVLDLFADVIRNPTFPKEEVERFKAQTLSGQQFQRSNPQFLVQQRFRHALYGDHPAGLSEPPIEAIRGMTPEDLARFHATYYRPNNAILAVAGDVTLKELLPKLERAFGSWQRGEVPATVIPPAPTPPAARVQLINRPGSVQTVLRLGDLGVTRNDPDYFALLVMNEIVGGGAQARLFMNLREDKGYTYGAYSTFDGAKFRGTWEASSEVRSAVTEGAMHEFMVELNRIRDEKVPPAELESAKRAIVGRFALSLEDPDRLLGNILDQKLYDLPADYWDTYPAKVAAITADDVQRAAHRYVDLAHLQIVAVGDAPKIRDVMAKYGTVEVYDANGRAVEALRP
jgi:predicted Zn-dependent peptidase